MTCFLDNILHIVVCSGENVFDEKNYKKEKAMEIRPFEKIPTCIGIIMDGNRRWERGRGGSPTTGNFEGHLAGYEKLKKAALWVRDFGIKHIVVFALSTENWGREKEEVDALMDIASLAFSEGFKNLAEEGVRIRVVGDRGKFTAELQRAMMKTENETAGNDALNLTLALSYGGRDEIERARNDSLGSPARDGAREPKADLIGRFLETRQKSIPDPDLIIRTGGEMRLSGFLLYQSAYSELFFTTTLWPDFSYWELLKILAEFQVRKRNFGK